MESVHFLGLSLLIGAIGLFDLRLLGLAKRIPIAALHRLIPWGLTGYGINIVSGAMFLMTEPDQYIYNPAFHFKLLFMGVAGFNALAFYLLAYRAEHGTRRAGRGAARGEDHRGDVVVHVDRGHRLRPAADVLPAGRLPARRTGIHRRVHPAPAMKTACPTVSHAPNLEHERREDRHDGLDGREALREGPVDSHPAPPAGWTE